MEVIHHDNVHKPAAVVSGVRGILLLTVAPRLEDVGVPGPRMEVAHRKVCSQALALHSALQVALPGPRGPGV